MFFEGTLQEGIATALQQGKLVVCFVTDGQDESQQWEIEFLGDGSLREPLSTHAVVLKLQAGSTEAGYLAAIFPLPKIPTLVIIKNGELKEYIAAGVSKQDFVSRTAKALGTASQQQTPTATDAVPSQGTISSSPSAQPPPCSPSSSSPQPSASTQPAPPPQPSSSSTPPPTQTPSTVQSLLTERAARLEAQRKKEADQRRLDKGKAKESSKPAADPDSAQSKHAEDLKRRQRQARDDRARVLQAIEDDKAARRARVSEREAERARAAGVPVSVQAEDNPALRKEDDDGMCKLQVRLFDGSTTRNRFPRTASLAGEVRDWLDEKWPGMRRAAGGGYGFKVVLTPLPSRSVDAEDEGKSLAELGLAPSATLVLVPTPPGKKGAAAAYPRAVGGNPVTRMVMAVVGVVMGLWALIVNFFGSLFSTAAAPLPEGGGVGIATGREQRKGGLRELRGERKDETQFYNGNSTNFEPRKDDDDE